MEEGDANSFESTRLVIIPMLKDEDLYRILSINLASRFGSLGDEYPQNHPPGACPWICTPDRKSLILNSDGFHCYVKQWIEYLIDSIFIPQGYFVSGVFILNNGEEYFIERNVLL